MYLTLEEVAKKLNKTRQQIQYLIKTNVAQPVNKDTYRRDRGYRFSIEEVNRLIERFSHNGLSLKEAARIVGVSPQYLNKLAKENVIKSRMITFGQRPERYFTLEDCEALKNKLQQNICSKRNKEYGIKLPLYQQGIRLFQPINIEGKKGRVINTSPLTILLGKEILEGIQPGTIKDRDWIKKPYITKKGFTEFRIPIPQTSEHQVYEMFYTMIEQLGEKNIQFYETQDGDYHIRCRKGKLILSNSQFDLLNRFIVKGKLHKEGNLVKIQTDYEQIYIELPSGLFHQIKSTAKDSTISEVIVSILKKEN